MHVKYLRICMQGQIAKMDTCIGHVKMRVPKAVVVTVKPLVKPFDNWIQANIDDYAHIHELL